MTEAGKQVTFHYTLTSGGEQLECSKGDDPLTFTLGGGEILPTLEAALQGLEAGDDKRVELSAADAYGEVNPDGFQEVEIDKIPEDARQVGAQLQAEGINNPIRVAEVRDDVIVLDFNHPMAGKDLVFDVEVVAVG